MPRKFVVTLLLLSIVFLIYLYTKVFLSDAKKVETPNRYLCPVTEWLDCMPKIGPVSEKCEPAYIQWAKNNCPNFKGGAY